MSSQSFSQVLVDLQTQKPTENLDPRTIKWIKSICGTEYSTISSLMTSPDWKKVHQAIEDGIQNANAEAISNVARVKKFKVLKNDFSVDGGELSPTLKLKRSVVAELYKDIIEQMYV